MSGELRSSETCGQGDPGLIHEYKRLVTELYTTLISTSMDSPIFIYSHPRTGSNLLAKLLETHPALLVKQVKCLARLTWKIILICSFGSTPLW